MTWGELGTLAAILGACIGASALVQAGLSTRTLTALHTETQRTLADLRQGVTESQERMDAHWHEAFERMDQRADERHREFLQALTTLRGS